MQSLQTVFLIFIIFASAESVLVELSNGRARGTRRGHYLAFEGIPYATAPVGELRFEPPQPYTNKWTDVWDARQPGAVCLQWDHFGNVANKLVGDEDCLFVNVYTPSLNSSLRHPVVVHIHGGAFMFGNGDFWNPVHFLRRNFVFVSFNYRVGPLGFLSTESSVVPGNMGLKDQVMALRWVQENIHAFGGDPEMVTLSGFSAGGASTHLHLMSDMSRGLFQRAIAHSGSALNVWALADGMLDKTKRIAVELGCTNSPNEKDIIRCLKQQPASEIVSTVSKFLKFLYNPFSPFGVVVEGDRDGSFLVDHPMNLLKQKRIHNVPVIMSAAEMEGLYPAAEFYNELTISEINDKWNEIIPAILDYQITVEKNKQDSVSQRIRSHYMGSSALTKETYHKFSKIQISTSMVVRNMSITMNPIYGNVNFSLYHFEGRQYLDVTMNLYKELKLKTMITYQISKVVKGRKRKLLALPKVNICDLASTASLIPVFAELVKNSDNYGNFVFSCPFKPEHYHLNKFPTTGASGKGFLPPGSYCSIVQLTDENVKKIEVLKIVTDRLYLADIGTSVRLHQAASPVYFYFFAYKSLFGIGEAMSHQTDCLGVGHGEDMLLLFPTPIRDEPYSNEEEAMLESLLDMYESFSATGSPVFGESKLVEAASDQNDDIVINKIEGPRKVKVESIQNFGDVQFWSSLNAL